MFKTQIQPNVVFVWPSFMAFWPYHQNAGRIEVKGKRERAFTVSGANHFNSRNNIHQAAEVARLAVMKLGDDIGGGYRLGKKDGVIWAFKQLTDGTAVILQPGAGTTAQALATIALAELTHTVSEKAKAAAETEAKAKAAAEKKAAAAAKAKATRAAKKAQVHVNTGK